MKNVLFVVFVVFLLSNCGKKVTKPSGPIVTQTQNVDKLKPAIKIGPESQNEVPILCYHNFSESTNTIITLSHERFEEQIRWLADSGYHSILPDQLYDYLNVKAGLPSKPIMISFDDTRLAQYTMAAPILEKYGFRGVFFIMTVCVNKPNYMSTAMITDLVTRGHAIGAHTYDHPLAKEIKDSQWDKELRYPKIFLENVLHNSVNFFAYPYGSWTEPYIEQLKKDGYKAAFQLYEPQSLKYPQYTIRRLMVEGYWSAKTLNEKMAKTFNSQPVAIK